MATRLVRSLVLLVLISLVVYSYISKPRKIVNIIPKNPVKIDLSEIIFEKSMNDSLLTELDALQTTHFSNINIKINDSLDATGPKQIHLDNKNIFNNTVKIHSTEKPHEKHEDLPKSSLQIIDITSEYRTIRFFNPKEFWEYLKYKQQATDIPLASATYESGHRDNEIDAERICPKSGAFIKLLVLITSARKHEAQRMAIRQTWMHYGSRRDIGMAFVLGRGTNATANERLDRENMMYADMIRGNFIDSYYNLTLKTISALEWSLWHCPLAKYVLKTDDDMFINMPKLMKFIDTLSVKRRIYGRRAENWMPVRNKQSKYFVSYRQFTARFFPYFTTGPAYLLTGDIVGELYAQSLATAYLKLEDVFLTGIVADILGIPRVNVKEIANTNTKAWACRVRDRITIHMVSPNEQFDLWKKLLDTSITCT